MTATIKSPKKLTNILTVSLLGVASLIALTACDNTPKQQENPLQGTVIKATDSTHNTEVVPQEPVVPDKDRTLASTTLTTLLQSVTIPLNASGILDTKEQQCINNIKVDFALDKVQLFFEEHLAPEALEELNTLYKTESAIVYTQYGRDQLLVSSGLPLATITQRPADEHMDKMKKFSRSKLGKKYIKLTKKKGKDSLSTLVMPLLTIELINCGVEIEHEGK